jgi:hypothetical protein
MKLTKNILPDYFTVASSSNSHYQVPTNTFDFVNRNSDILLVTVGESWTWGSDLTETDVESTRLTQTFGNIISTELSADWLNLAQPGSSNFFIAEKVEELGCIISMLEYKQIYLVCTFTEVGRGFNSHHDCNIDYNNWFRQHLLSTESDFFKFLEFLNADCLRRIRTVVDTHNLKFILGSNFVDAIGINSDPGFLKTPWFRLLNIDCPVTGYAGSTGVTRLADIIEFVPSDKKSLFKSWFIELVNQSVCIDAVCSSHILVKTHPTADGHKLWAKYILENIK